jgi:hypothetical protein
MTNKYIPVRLGDSSVRLLPIGEDGIIDSRPKWVQNSPLIEQPHTVAPDVGGDESQWDWDRAKDQRREIAKLREKLNHVEKDRAELFRRAARAVEELGGNNDMMPYSDQ